MFSVKGSRILVLPVGAKDGCEPAGGKLGKELGKELGEWSREETGQAIGAVEGTATTTSLTAMWLNKTKMKHS